MTIFSKPERTAGLSQIRRFAEAQSEDMLLFSDSDHVLVNYLQGHLRILHQLIQGELTMRGAEHALEDIEY